MESSIDCVPCLLRQAIQVSRMVTDSPAVQERMVREALHAVAEMEFHQSPPVVSQVVNRRLRVIAGDPDPYRAVKAGFNRLALELLPRFEAQVARAPDPLGLAVRFAIAGNVIDMGANAGLTEDHVRASIHRVLEEPFTGDVEAFRWAVSQAKDILYLADNAGEIVFDRLLVAQLPRERVTVAVRGAPVINDATLHDAREAGLHELAELVDNGSDAPGTLLGDCSPAFRERYRRADLIIAKGQGNFESLSEVSEPVWFLFKVKCPLAAAHVGHPVGTHVLEAAAGA